MSNYKTGSGAQQIKLSVDISTIGLAATRASVAQVNPPGTPVGVAHSNDATGDVPTTDIGAASSCSNHKLIVMTKVDISAIPSQNDRIAEYQRISSSITLSGGTDGLRAFSPADIKEHSDDYKAVALYSEIFFTA